MKDETNLTEQEGRLADLLFDVEDDPDFVNTVMEMADELDVFDETSGFIESHPNCTSSDVYRFVCSYVEIEITED